MKKNEINNILLKKTLLFLLFCLMAIPVGWMAFINLQYKDSPLPNIYLNQKNYSDFSQEEAKENLARDIQEKYSEGMKFKYQEKEFTLELSDLEIKIDEEKTINEIFNYGKNGNILENIQKQIKSFEEKTYLQNQIKESESLLSEEKWKKLSQLESPANDFSYSYKNGDFIEIEPNDGYIIDKNKLKNDIIENLKELKNEEIQIELIEDKAIVRDDENKNALSTAKELINKKILLEYDSEKWEVEKEDFAQWFSFEPSFDGEKYVLKLSAAKEAIENYILSLVPQINQEPVNAQLESKDGKVTMFSLSKEGIRVDVEDSVNEISKQIFNNQNLTEQEEIPVRLITENIEPEITTKSIDNMGITSLLAVGESNFHGSTESRKHNVAVGASKFNGILIGPGEEFSFNSILGDVNAKEGYLPELVIKQGQTIAEYGGGLCQVSTTAFRGAVSAGLEVTERQNHAYAVKYYSPQGTDATIYPPHPDLAFINNTPAYILIQTRISGDDLYFDFYGSDDGRKVELEGPVVYEYGEGGAMKTYWKQTVYDENEEVFLEDTFYSNYKSPDLYPRTNPLE